MWIAVSNRDVRAPPHDSLGVLPVMKAGYNKDPRTRGTTNLLVAPRRPPFHTAEADSLKRLRQRAQHMQDVVLYQWEQECRGFGELVHGLQNKYQDVKKSKKTVWNKTREETMEDVQTASTWSLSENQSLDESSGSNDIYYKTPSDEMSTLSFDSAEECAAVVGKNVVDSYGDQGVYSGEILVSTVMPHGFGKMIYKHMGPEHRVYEGEWRHGRWYGFGAIQFENGDSYNGACLGGQRHGHGRYEWKTGKVYVGDFRDDNRHGFGRLEYPDGSSSEGCFKHGHLVGPIEGE